MTKPAMVRVKAPTELRNPRTLQIDAVDTLTTLRLINAEDALVAGAVEKVLPELARLVDIAVEKVRAGGRVHYFGAGTSGRLGVLDAAEIVPTFNADPSLVVGHHAGGHEALVRAVENVEDSEEAGAADAGEVTAADLVIGIAASGRTPYVGGALRQAASVGAATGLISCNPGASLAELVDVHVAPDTGAEAVAGSTRMKAGTATKLALNGFSTALMIRLGRTYSNLMVSVRATNSKLRGRLVTILNEATGEPDAACLAALEAADGDLRTALVTMLTGCTPAEAAEALTGEVGVREAVARIKG